jgi:hypothetical protein
MAGVRLRSLHGNKLYNRDKPCIGTTFMHTPVNQNKSRTDLSQWWREFRTLLVPGKVELPEHNNGVALGVHAPQELARTAVRAETRTTLLSWAILVELVAVLRVLPCRARFGWRCSTAQVHKCRVWFCALLRRFLAVLCAVLGCQRLRSAWHRGYV